jgi:hypothetical protein
VDRVIPAFIAGQATTEAFLASAREQLRSRTFIPLPVRERLIPKPGKRGQFRGSVSPPRWTGWCRPAWCWCWCWSRSFHNRPITTASPTRWIEVEKGKLIERPDQTPDKEADEDVNKVAA